MTYTVVKQWAAVMTQSLVSRVAPQPRPIPDGAHGSGVPRATIQGNWPAVDSEPPTIRAINSSSALLRLLMGLASPQVLRSENDNDKSFISCSIASPCYRCTIKHSYGSILVCRYSNLNFSLARQFSNFNNFHTDHSKTVFGNI